MLKCVHMKSMKKCPTVKMRPDRAMLIIVSTSFLKESKGRQILNLIKTIS